jgi:hypothetical protein
MTLTVWKAYLIWSEYGLIYFSVSAPVRMTDVDRADSQIGFRLAVSESSINLIAPMHSKR